MLRERSHTSWQQLQEWQYSGSGAFAVAVTDATRARLYCVPTIRGLLRQALPDALGPLIAAQTPTLMAMAVHVGLLRLIGDALVCLEHGALPVIDGFPLAPDSVGKAVSFRGLKIDNPRAFQDMLSLTAYGSGASSLGHEPLFEGHRQRVPERSGSPTAACTTSSIWKTAIAWVPWCRPAAGACKPMISGMRRSDAPSPGPIPCTKPCRALGSRLGARLGIGFGIRPCTKAAMSAAKSVRQTRRNGTTVARAGKICW